MVHLNITYCWLPWYLLAPEELHAKEGEYEDEEEEEEEQRHNGAHTVEQRDDKVAEGGPVPERTASVRQSTAIPGAVQYPHVTWWIITEDSGNAENIIRVQYLYVPLYSTR